MILNLINYNLRKRKKKIHIERKYYGRFIDNIFIISIIYNYIKLENKIIYNFK